MCYDFQTEMEKKLYDGLVNCQKALSQRDSTINDLKAIALQWQTKANESKLALKEVNKETEERELYLEKHYLAEIQAIKYAQEDQTNEHLDLILYLQRENQQLRNQSGHHHHEDSVLYMTDQQKHLMDSGFHGGTGTLCYSTEAANEIALSKVVNSRKQSDELIQSIYDTVNAMEESLHDISSSASSDCEENDRDYCDSPISTRQPPRPHTPPILTDMHAYHSATLASADTYTIHEPTILEKQKLSSLLSKTQSCRMSPPPAAVAIERKRFSSMIESSHSNSQKKWVHRKPIRNSIISSH
ncbi:hypothetical protein K501DRAFT_328980 [Backusella circina FSU 941]|nr:hypothetical protein K501DRAFT_328980 [Backusella circina FSU 941]